MIDVAAVPTADELGGITTSVGYSESEFVYALSRKLEKRGFTNTYEALPAPKFPGFQVDKFNIKRTSGMRRNPDARPIDLLAWRDDLVLVIEAKVAGVERGLGQILLNGDIYKRCRLMENQHMVMVLAAPDYAWHPGLPEVAASVNVVPWVFWTGKQWH